jgi:hypothetical protein
MSVEPQKPTETDMMLPNIKGVMFTEEQKIIFRENVIAEWIERSDALIATKIRFFRLILNNHISAESLTVLSFHDDFKAAERNECLDEFGRIIRETHATKIWSQYPVLASMTRLALTQQFAKLVQDEEASVSQFYVSYRRLRKRLRDCGLADIDAADEALDFAMRLDVRRFRSLITSLKVSAIKGKSPNYTLYEMYTIASYWRSDGVTSWENSVREKNQQILVSTKPAGSLAQEQYATVVPRGRRKRTNRSISAMALIRSDSIPTAVRPAKMSVPRDNTVESISQPGSSVRTISQHHNTLSNIAGTVCWRPCFADSLSTAFQSAFKTGGRMGKHASSRAEIIRPAWTSSNHEVVA